MTWDPYSNFLGICQDSTPGQALSPPLLDDSQHGCGCRLECGSLENHYLGTSYWCPGTFAMRLWFLWHWLANPHGTTFVGWCAWVTLKAWHSTCLGLSLRPHLATAAHTYTNSLGTYYLGLLDLPDLQLSDLLCYTAYHMTIKRKQIKKNLHCWCFASRKSLFSWSYISHF